MKKTVLVAVLALLLAQGGLGGQETMPGQMEPREEGPAVTRPQEEEPRPGVGAQTGRGGTLAPRPGETTGRVRQPGCTPAEQRTGRGGQVCRPAEELPRVGRFEEPVVRPREFFGPESPTGPETGDYPRVFPPYGSESGNVPPPYGPGLGDGRTPGYQGR